MKNETDCKLKILIADDSEINRSILSDILSKEYDIIEAGDGNQTVSVLQEQREHLSLLLPDTVMPQADGFDVLKIMNEYGWIDELPVIMISANSNSSDVEKAYELGVTEFINSPFDALIVCKRVANTILLCCKQNRLNSMVRESSINISDKNSLLKNCSENLSQNRFRNNRESHYYSNFSASDRTLRLLEQEFLKYNFFAALSKEIQFEYTNNPNMVKFSNWGAEMLGLDEIMMAPLHNKQLTDLINSEDWSNFLAKMRSSTIMKPNVTHDCRFLFGGEWRWFQIIARSIWNTEDPPKCAGAIGKVVDVHDSHVKLESLEWIATHDSLTGLYNHASAKKLIESQINKHPDSKYAVVIFDLDWFKKANDNYGHLLGDQLLIHLADKLRQCTRENDITIRVGGDEFAVFLEYKMNLEAIIRRIYQSLCGKFQGFSVSISMGIARSEELGNNYDAMFHAEIRLFITANAQVRLSSVYIMTLWLICFQPFQRLIKLIMNRIMIGDITDSADIL